MHPLCLLLTVTTLVAAPALPPATSSEAPLATPVLAFEAFHRAHLAKDGPAAAALLSDPEFYKKKFVEQVSTMPDTDFKELQSIKLIDTRIEGNVAVALHTIRTHDGQLRYHEMWFVRHHLQWHPTLLANEIPEETTTLLRKWSAERQTELRREKN